jgi:hypothetical protein
MLNSRIEQNNSVRGFNYDYGVQYIIDFTDTKHLTLGYSASTGNNINAAKGYIVSQYTYDSSGNENLAADSVVNSKSPNAKIKLPAINHFGLAFESDGHFLVGADYTMGKWSTLAIDGVTQGLQDSRTFNIGGQFTPDANALRNYFARADYRLGFIYNDTYLNLPNPSGSGSTDIKQMAITAGLGLPLAPNNLSFYKINFAVEYGKQGTLQNGFIKENYVNIHLAFTLNDKWFQRFKFQ